MNNVSARQVISIIIISRLATTVSVMYSLNISPDNQDIWIAILLSIVYCHLFMSPLLFLSNKFNDCDMIGIYEKIYGKVIGRILTFLYVIYFLINTIDITTIQSELLTTSILADSSKTIIVTLMIITAVYCTSRGIDTLLRLVEVIAPVSIGLIIFLLILGISGFDPVLLLPVFADSSFLDINIGAMKLALQFIEVMILVMVVPYLQDKGDINKIFTKSTIYVFSLIAVIVVLSQITIGIDYLKYSNFPFLLYARSINIAVIFERIDLIAVIAWLIASICRLCAALFLCIATISKLFSKNKDKGLIIIIGIVLGILTIYISDRVSVVIMRQRIDFFLGILFIIFAIAIPSLSCIVYFIRRKSIEAKNNI